MFPPTKSKEIPLKNNNGNIDDDGGCFRGNDAPEAIIESEKSTGLNSLKSKVNSNEQTFPTGTETKKNNKVIAKSGIALKGRGAANRRTELKNRQQPYFITHFSVMLYYYYFTF